MPTPTQGLSTAKSTFCRWWREMLPACFIPWESMESPAAAKTVTPASTRYLRKVTGTLTAAAKILIVGGAASFDLAQDRPSSAAMFAQLLRREPLRGFPATSMVQTLTGSAAAAAASSLCRLTSLLRMERTLRKVLASLYRRLRSLLLKAAFFNMRNTALGRK